MSQQARTSFVFGLVLVILGGYFLLMNFIPGLPGLLPSSFSWPWIIISIGGGLLLLGLVVGSADMAVPAFIVGGIGGILLYQNTTENWGSWSYMWALIPGFVGLGTIAATIIKGNWGELREGIRLLFISAVLFAIFSAVMGGPNLLGQWWPILLILLGIYVIINPRLPRTNR